MKNITVIAKDRSAVQDAVATELNKVGLSVIGIISAIIGCWAVACFAAGLVSSGGVVNLVSDFIVSFTG